MAVSEFLAKYGTIVKPTITLASLANGAGRVSAIIDNTVTRAPMAMVFVRITTGGTAPTANTPVRVYLVRHSNDGTLDLADNGLGSTDAALTVDPTSAEILGSIIVTAATNATYTKTFLAYDLPPDYNIAIWNATGQALNATAGNFAVQVLPITMEAQ
jgi:hypothetical protein